MSSRFEVRLLVALSSFRLAYNVRGFAKFVFVGVEKIPDFILLKFWEMDKGLIYLSAPQKQILPKPLL